MSDAMKQRQQDLFERFARIGHAVAGHAAAHDSQASFDFESWAEVTAAGLWRLPVPEAYGGLGGSWQDCLAAMEGLASAANDLGFMISTLGHIGSLRVILEEGSEAQRARWLPALMDGAVAVTAMTESTGGSDLARMQLSATSVADGWRLDGRKVHITNAPIASVGMIAGRMPALGPKKDITLFFIDMDQTGVSLGEPEDNLGIRTSPTADLIFDDAPIGHDNIVGAPGDGLRILYRIISFERALYGVIASGLIDNMLRQSMDRAESRTSFGRPLADYQYIQGRITEMKIAAVQCRTLSYTAIQTLDDGASDASILCSVTKFQAGEKLLEAAEHLVQLHGHLGYMNNDLSRQLRDAVGMRIAGGTSDIQRINIFNQLRRAHRTARGDAPEVPAVAAE
jgi:alkylation response protein AidB-like acyl-CoA dehydrogenase